MQLQIECNSLKQSSQTCCICNEQFEPNQAKIILYDEQETVCGEVCPHCLHQGFDWIKQRFERSYLLTQANRSLYYAKSLNSSKKLERVKNMSVPVGV